MGCGPVQNPVYTVDDYRATDASTAVDTERSFVLPIGCRNINIRAWDTANVSWRYSLISGVVATGGPVVCECQELEIQGPLGQPLTIYWATSDHPVTLEISAECVS